MSGGETAFARHRELMARVGDLLRRSGRLPPFASMLPLREPRIGAPPESFSKREIEALMSKEARGWDQRVRNAVGVPESMLVSREAAYVLYSQDREFGIAKVCGDLVHARTPAEMPGYGIAIDGSRGSSVYFVLADPTRRIIVRELLSCIHNENYSEWQAVAASIESAARFAERAPGGVVIHNGGRPYMV